MIVTALTWHLECWAELQRRADSYYPTRTPAQLRRLCALRALAQEHYHQATLASWED